MLRPRTMSPTIPIMSPPVIHLDKVPRRMCQVMIPTFKLLEIRIVNQPPLPQVLEETEIRSRRTQRLAPHRVFLAQMLHAHAPRMSAQVARRRPVAQWTLHRLRRFLAAKVRRAMRFPLFSVLRDVSAVEEPEGAFVEGCCSVQRAGYF